MDPRAEGARELILAIFRLAVADYLGIAYGHDGPGPMRRMKDRPFLAEAVAFLASAWGAYLADLIGLQAGAIWREARQLASVSRLPLAA
ncbi:MAG TPA: hypothetical protein VIT43_12415 [Candidatus Dormibacteraeota bacterium]